MIENTDLKELQSLVSGMVGDIGAAASATFEVANARGFLGKDYDVIAFFDCLHDMRGPVKHVCATPKKLMAHG
jgi:hypothetical protein